MTLQALTLGTDEKELQPLVGRFVSKSGLLFMSDVPGADALTNDFDVFLKSIAAPPESGIVIPDAEQIRAVNLAFYLLSEPENAALLVEECYMASFRGRHLPKAGIRLVPQSSTHTFLHPESEALFEAMIPVRARMGRRADSREQVFYTTRTPVAYTTFCKNELRTGFGYPIVLVREFQGYRYFNHLETVIPSGPVLRRPRASYTLEADTAPLSRSALEHDVVRTMQLHYQYSERLKHAALIVIAPMTSGPDLHLKLHIVQKSAGNWSLRCDIIETLPPGLFPPTTITATLSRIIAMARDSAAPMREATEASFESFLETNCVVFADQLYERLTGHFFEGGAARMRRFLTALSDCAEADPVMQRWFDPFFSVADFFRHNPRRAALFAPSNSESGLDHFFSQN